MMEKVAEKKRMSESNTDGLVILKATYWVESRDIQGKIISMDATKQLQFWVSNGKLHLPSVPKAAWLGFYNLQTERSPFSPGWDWRFWRRWTRRAVHPQPRAKQPQLTIRFACSGYVYEITVGETEAVTLPCTRAQLLGYAGSVQ
jgi:hypothetical protein